MTTGSQTGRRPATAEELASRPVRFAIVGTGGMGGTHARNLASSPEAEVTWLVDLDTDRAQKLADDIGGKVTAEMDEAFASDDVDVALIALPTGLHRMGVEKAAEYRKHVFCEKPIGLLHRSYGPLARLADAAAGPATAAMRSRVRRRVAGDPREAWMHDELMRNEPSALLASLGSLGRFRSTAWSAEIDVPTAVVVTSRDATVAPSRQRALADSIAAATSIEVDGPHDAIVTRPHRHLPALATACELVVDASKARRTA